MTGLEAAERCRANARSWRNAYDITNDPDDLGDAEAMEAVMGTYDELLAACKAALPWVALAMVSRDDAHPEAVANHAADLDAIRAAIAKAEGGDR